MISWRSANPARMVEARPDGLRLRVVAEAELGADDPAAISALPVATRPQQQGKGPGRRLMVGLQRFLTTDAPADFGYLGCREEIVGYHERVGWHRIDQKTREIDPGSRECTVSDGPTLILPATSPSPAWPRGGTIYLRGMRW